MPARAAGYRLLGGGLDYLLHLRPAEWPIMAAHTSLGYLLAVRFEGLIEGRHAGAFGAGLALWVLCLNGGTLAINSAFDRDTADIAYLRRPPPPPPGLFRFGLALMAAGQLGAFLLGWRFAAAYGFCFLLSVLYSVPPARLKAVAGADWLINLVGFGAMTPLAGWLSTGLPLRAPETMAMLAFAPLFAAFYPLTQLYQLEDDRHRGDRTFALALGARRSLAVALGATFMAFAALAAAGAAAGWNVAAPGRWALIGTALAGWLAVLLPWHRRAETMTPREHERGMYRALAAWGLTDIAVVISWLA